MAKATATNLLIQSVKFTSRIQSAVILQLNCIRFTRPSTGLKTKRQQHESGEKCPFRNCYYPLWTDRVKNWNIVSCEHTDQVCKILTLKNPLWSIKIKAPLFFIYFYRYAIIMPKTSLFLSCLVTFLWKLWYAWRFLLLLEGGAHCSLMRLICSLQT